MGLLSKLLFSRFDRRLKKILGELMPPASVEKILAPPSDDEVHAINGKAPLREMRTCVAVASNSSGGSGLFNDGIANEIVRNIEDVGSDGWQPDGWQIDSLSPVPTLYLNLSEDDSSFNIKRIMDFIGILTRAKIRIVMTIGMVKWGGVGSAKFGMFGSVVNSAVVGAVELPQDRSWIDESLAHMLGIAVSAPFHELAGSKFTSLGGV